MKKALSLFICFIFFVNSNAQVQKNSLHGKILDTDKNILPGASLIIVGTKYGVNANESGDYLFDKIADGKIKIQVSFIGFKTLITEFDVQPGRNDLDLTLESDNVKLEGVTVTSQKREQQVLDVPITMSVIGSVFMEDNNITELERLSVFVPGLQIRMQGIDRPGFVIRGLTSDEVSPAAQPRISVFYNNVPVSRANGAAVELFDMQQIDVLKGPQGTLFGRGAEIGAINYVSNKPTNDFSGFITAGAGNYKQKELSGAINIPVIKNKLLVRVAGIYDYQDGFVKNTFGGNLNGKNTLAGRFSASYLPNINNKIDFVLNYQKDDNPGLGFMSMSYPNTNGSNNPFGYVASLEQGRKLANRRDILDATLTMKHFFNENNYLTSVSSYRKIASYSRWDGDGTAAAAIDMSEDDDAGQFFQEIRYNYSIKSKLNGSIGASYWIEDASQDYWFSPDEQDMFHLFFNTGGLVTPDGQPNPVTNLPPDPQLGPLAGAPLVTDHQEENNNMASNQALEGFADANYQLTDKLSVTGGIRIISEWISLTNSAKMTGGSPSTLGFLTGNYPNLFFKPVDENETGTSNVALTYRGGLKYSFNENSSLFANYSKGRRPKVLQFTSAGEEQVLEAEIVNSFDLGFKTAIQNRFWFDLGLFYYGYSNFQTSAWVADPESGEFNYIVKDGGKASGYGTEANIRYAILNGLQVFGNYSYIHSRFADTDADGARQNYAGNMFRLTPEHSFALGLNGRVEIGREIFLFGVPSFSYQTKIYFEDANTAGLEQAAYGLLNLRAGIGYKNITLAFYGTNLLEEKFIVSAGNTGSLFGDPTQIPGAPRMFGTKLNWKF
ncbi:MAG: TonB-dependent receptor [Bacteroidales bacterium]|nr:TonB-dependent receptor [Bacteroidales bacterium]